jgi:hypothetical protein
MKKLLGLVFCLLVSFSLFAQVVVGPGSYPSGLISGPDYPPYIGTCVNGNITYNVATQQQSTCYNNLWYPSDKSTLIVVNASSTGTTINLLAKLTSGNAVLPATTDNKNGAVIGVVMAGAGTTGSALIVNVGFAQCVFDNSQTAGDFVTVSTSTAGDCHDYGSSLPVDGSEVLGRVLQATTSTSVAQNVLLFGDPIGGSGYGSSIAAAATLSLTIANCGQLVLMGQTGGEVVTLPAASAATVGCTYEFAITTTNTSASNEIRTNSSSNFLLGAANHSATGIAGLMFWADGSTIQAIKMNGSTTGGLIGSTFRVVGISATQWEISGTNECTATCTTAFTATP